MGTYYSATTVIGFKVSTKDCYINGKEPNCRHKPPTGVAFCPECGTRVGSRQTSSSKEAYDEFLENFAYKRHTPYVYQTHYDNDGDCFWFGYGSSAEPGETERRDLKPYEEIKAEIVKMLEPFTSDGLFALRDENFGIWTLHAGH